MDDVSTSSCSLIHVKLVDCWALAVTQSYRKMVSFSLHIIFKTHQRLLYCLVAHKLLFNLVGWLPPSANLVSHKVAVCMSQSKRARDIA